MDFPGPSFAHDPFEPSISGCLTGDLGVPGYEPDGISWLPHPATSSSHGAPAVVRPHWNVSDKPIAGPRSEELAKTREVFQSSFQFDLAGGVRLERTDLPEDESAQCLRVGDDRDVGGIHTAVDQA